MPTTARTRRAIPNAFLKMRAAAYQAYYEHMPLPASARPRRTGCATIYAHYRFGDMLDMLLLDDRQYRSAAGLRAGRTTDDGAGLRGAHARSAHDARAAAGAMAGSRSWPTRRARWTIVAQQTLMAEARRRDAEGGDRYWMDGWDGYPNARRRLLGCDRDAQGAQSRRHRRRPPRLSSPPISSAISRGRMTPTIATEFVGTSITSDGPGPGSTRSALANNPELLYANGEKRGYAVMDLDGRSCTVGFEALDNVKDAQSPVRRLATFVVEDGVPGAKAA